MSRQETEYRALLITYLILIEMETILKDGVING